MTVSAVVVYDPSHTDGVQLHTGRLIVRYLSASGTLISITLPDDWQTLLDRVAALEANAAVDSLEDLTYGG
jgi:hypothetical protein